MTQLCRVCQHPDRKEIDLALLLHLASYRVIASHFGVVMSSLQRHEQNHLHLTYAKSQELNNMLSADNLLSELGDWHRKMREQYDRADHADNVMAAVATAKVGIQAIESFSRIGVQAELERRVAALENGNGEDESEPEGEQNGLDEPDKSDQ